MQPLARTLLRNIGDIFRDTLLQRLILFVIAAAFFFAVVLDADSSSIFLLVVVGLIGALLESAHHRKSK
jgi:hypothetical protein